MVNYIKIYKRRINTMKHISKLLFFIFIYCFVLITAFAVDEQSKPFEAKLSEDGVQRVVIIVCIKDMMITFHVIGIQFHLNPLNNQTEIVECYTEVRQVLFRT